VISNEEQTGAAGDRSTHAVDIVAFVEANELAHHHVETPYRLVPAPGGERLYSLLRDTLERTGRIAIAYVVIHAHQHLAALVPNGASLMLNTLRWIRETPSGPRETLLPRDEGGDAAEDETALMAQAFGLGAREEEADDGDTFRADILTPEFLTEDDDEADTAIARALRRHPGISPAQAARRQRPAPRIRQGRPRMRSRLLS